MARAATFNITVQPQLWTVAGSQLKPHCRPSEVANGPLRGCGESHAARSAFSGGRGDSDSDGRMVYENRGT